MSRTTVIRAAILLLLTAYVFWPALNGTWIWDDNVAIDQNRIFQDPAGWHKIWFQANGPDYFPLKDTVQWVETRIWGSNPTVYHVTNVLLHSVSALLLWAVFRRLLPRTEEGALAAWGGGLLFSIHPLTVESVAWMSELKNTLSLPILLGAFLAYLNWDEHRSPRSYLWALGLFAAALLAKTSVVMLPGVLLLYAAWRRGRVGGKDIVASARFLALSLVFGLVTVHYQHGQLAFPDGPPMGGIASRFAGAGLAIVFYLWKFVMPVRLLMIYPQWALTPVHPWQLLPWAGLLVLGGWLWSRRRVAWGRTVLFGIGFFLINLIPVLGFIRMSYGRFSWVADHFVYLPMIGIVGIVASAFYVGISRPVGPGRSSVIAAAALLVVTLALLTRSQAALFKNATAVWTHTLRFNPRAWVAEYDLGSEAYAQQQPLEAISHFEAALRINPMLSEVENSLGATLAQQGRPREAVVHLTRALDLYSAVPRGHFNLGTTLMRLGQYGDAIVHYQAAARAAPRSVEIWSNLGLALAHTGRLDEAIASYQTALQIDPTVVRVHDNLGYTQLMRGQSAAGIAEFEKALRLQPDDADADFGLGNAMMMTHHPDLAIPHYAAALRVRPDFAAARRNLESAQREVGGKR